MLLSLKKLMANLKFSLGNNNLILNILFSLIPLSYIIGNFAINLNVFFIIVFSQFIFLIVNKFEIKDYFYTKLFGVTLTPLIYLFVMYDFLILQIFK